MKSPSPTGDSGPPRRRCACPGRSGIPGITLRGPKGEVRLDHGVIVAQRHIHMPPERPLPGASQTARWCGSKCSLPGRWYSTTWWCGGPQLLPPGFIDFDEANACAYQSGDFGMIIRG